MRLIQHLHPTIKQTFLLAVIPAISFNAMAGEKVDKTLTTSASPIVEIEHVAGKATITGWDKNQVKVTGELGDRTEAFIFEKKGDDVILKVETNHRKIDWRDKNPGDGDDLTIFVPAKSDLSYTAVVADVEASRLTNSVQFDVVNGDIDVSDLAGKVKLESVNGDIKLDNVSGLLQVETVNGNISGNHKGDKSTRIITVNGDIKLKTSSPDVQLESVNGDAKLELSEIDVLSLTTVNGDITASLTLAEKGDVDASSVGGTLHLKMQKGVSARVEMQAHAGGDIVNRLTADKPSSAKYGPNEWLEFTANGGRATIEMSTVHGELIVE